MKHFSIYSLILLLGACGGSDAPKVDPDQLTLPTINPSAISLAKLKPATSADLKNSIKNGIYRDLHQSTRETDPLPAAPISVDAALDGADNFSVTVTAELGVDEIDSVKYNGKYLYVLDNTSGNFGITDVLPPAATNSSSLVRVYERQNDDNLLELNSITDNHSENSTSYTHGLYTHNDDIITFGSSNSYGYWALDTLVAPQSQRFFFNIYDMSEPNEPVLTEKFSVDGYLLDSRKIGQYLILVSSFSPSINAYNMNPSSDLELSANLTLLEDTSVDDFLPQYTINDQAQQNLVNADECFIPNDADSLDGHAGIVSLTVIDLLNPTLTRSICVNGYYDGMYASQDSVILFGQTYDKGTVVHHFNFTTNEFTYNGSAVVPGHLGWNQPQLRLSVYNNHLRVVSTENTGDETDRLDHTLSIFNLDVDNAELSLTGQLPNATKTNEIGKPNEDVMAVRFFNNKGYVVTFERIDPLYVLDLAEPSNPSIAGELEMPGFSSYLQPINDDFVLGIGQNVDPNRFTSDILIEQPITEGAKVALFDVSGTPRIVNEFVFANAGTPVQFNYKALTYLAVSESEHWFALPMTSWDAPEQADKNWTVNNRLELFEVDLLGNASMSNSGRVSPDFSDSPYWGSWDDRAVIHNETIYYIHGGRVWQANWSSPDDLLE